MYFYSRLALLLHYEVTDEVTHDSSRFFLSLSFFLFFSVSDVSACRCAWCHHDWLRIFCSFSCFIELTRVVRRDHKLPSRLLILCLFFFYLRHCYAVGGGGEYGFAYYYSQSERPSQGYSYSCSLFSFLGTFSSYSWSQGTSQCSLSHSLFMCSVWTEGEVLHSASHSLLAALLTYFYRLRCVLLRAAGDLVWVKLS